MSYPTEAEIRDAATRLGLVDENGRYPRRDRNRIAAAIQNAGGLEVTPADLDGPRDAEADPTTAQQLARFADELDAAGTFASETTTALLTEAARFLLRTEGLQLNSNKGETTP